MKKVFVALMMIVVSSIANANPQCQAIKEQIRAKKGSCKPLPKEQRQACRSEIQQLKAQHQACKAQAKASKGSKS